MPRKAKDYSKALVYKLCCLDPNVKEIYVGSTTNFTKRKRGHKSNCNNTNGRDYHLKVYQYMRANGNWENWNMVLIEYFPCETELELGRREDYWKQELQASLNSYTPPIYETKQDCQKIYRKDNKEHIAEQKKEWYQKNRERILEQVKQKFTCECGKVICKGDKAKHFKTLKHQNYLAENTDK